MRRSLFLVLALGIVAMVLWRLGALPGTGGGGDRATDAGASGREDAVPLLHGRASEPSDPAPEALPDAAPPAPAGPPDWPHGTVTGRVVGPGGRPLPDSGASGLAVFSLYGDASLYCSGAADAEGRFVLYVRARLPTVVVAGAMGHALAVGPRVALEAGATRDVGTLRLEPERRLPVRVVDEEGAPVQDVDVYLDAERDPQPEGWEAALTASGILSAGLTDAAGRVVFDMLPPGPWRVSIDTGATRTRDQVREHVEANGDDVVFVLPSRSAPDTLRVRVRILDPQGEPVHSARVHLQAEACSQSAYWHAAENETLELECALGPVRMVVEEARDAERALLPYAPVVVPDVRGLAGPVVVRMERGATITGRVAWDGDPATWRILASGWFDPERGVCEADYGGGNASVPLSFRSQTEADGSFCVTGLTPGRFTLVAEGPGRLPSRPPVVEAGAQDVVLELVAAGRIVAHVLAPKGLRFGNVTLHLEERLGEGVQDCTGWHGGGGDRPDVRVFEAEELRVDGRYRLRAWGRCSGVSCPPVVLDDVVPREAPYVLQLEETPHVRGVVEREDGTPVWGAQVRYRPWPGGELDPNTFVDGRWLDFAATDAGGAFDLSGFGDEEIVLAVMGLGLVLRDPPPSVVPGTSGIRLVVVPERRIRGRVEDPAGGPLDGLRAAAVPDRGTPGLWTPCRVMADGFFEVGGLAPGTLRVVVWNERDRADGRVALSEPIPAGTRDVRLRLAPGPALEGAVHDASKRPVPGAQVLLLGRWTNRRARTDGEGRYAFAGLPPDVELELEAVTATGRSARKTVRLPPGARTTTVDVTLPAR